MTLPFLRFQGIVYRGHDPRWAYDPLSGAGAIRHGGRFNPKGVACLYTSLTPETAWLEVQAGFAFKAQPLTLCAYEVDCENMIDLTSHSGQVAVGTTLEELDCAWEDIASKGGTPFGWALAERLTQAGASGILVPSFASRAGSKDVNAVFWKWSEKEPFSIRVIDDFSRLPRDDSSWRQE
ncbi:MAG: RES domain-containing protein [Aquisalinus sp.]|nr:RES domain-containing protein [Aquisalinus sp.]